MYYYWSIFTMVVLDARKFGATQIAFQGDRLMSLMRKYGFHFISWFAIAGFMMWGDTAILSVAYAIVLGIGLGLGALAAGLTGWLLVKTTIVEGAILIAAGLVLVYPSLIQDLFGIGLFSLAGYLHYRRRGAPAV